MINKIIHLCCGEEMEFNKDLDEFYCLECGNSKHINKGVLK